MIRSMHKYMVFMVSAALGTGIAFADAADLPRFVDALDACETLWRSEKYEQLYGYIDELKQKSPDYAPVVFLSATRERKFGGQYEEESAQLRSLTNRLHQVLCEVNPEALPRLGVMADDADESVRLCEKLGQDREYRRIHSNPLKTRRKTHVPCLPCCFVDIAFLLPDMSLSNNSPSVNLRLPAQERRKALDARVLGAKIFDYGGHVSYRQKKNLLDDYVHEIASAGGASGLVEKLKDDLVQLDGYYALSMLREKGSEAKQLLKEYVEREDSSIGADEAKRMAVWALLQFAHDDPEVASYLKHLPAKVDAANWKTKAYLGMAVRHLDEGCSRHFQCSGAGDSKSRKDVAPQKTGAAGKRGNARGCEGPLRVKGTMQIKWREQ